MEPLSLKPKKGPEAKIQAEIIKALKIRNWMVKETHGNLYQFGFPDLFAAHKKYGQRWIEVKNKTSYQFTKAQYEWFPQFAAHGVGIWILVSADEDELKKLFLPANWVHYWK